MKEEECKRVGVSGISLSPADDDISSSFEHILNNRYNKKFSNIYLFKSEFSLCFVLLKLFSSKGTNTSLVFSIDCWS